MRWTPAHLGVEENEHADALAKRAAEGEEGRASPEYLGEASPGIPRERPRRPDLGLPRSGSEDMSARSVGTAPHREECSARG